MLSVGGHKTDMSQTSAKSKKADSGKKVPPAAGGVDDDMRHLLRRAEKLDPKRHADLRVVSGRDFQFVSGLHTIPLSAVEFMPSARHYPIIFAGDEDVFPVALLGLQPGENLFVNAKGRWKEGCYVPAILRRAPFVLMEDSKGGKQGVSLCLDVESPLVSKEDGTPLFANDKPTELVAQMANFAAAYSKEQSRTKSFVSACVEHDLLVSRRMDITLATGQQIVFSGFKVIDQDRLRKIEDSEALKWFRRGWSALAVSHILSLGNMGRLHHRANARARLRAKK